MIVYIREQGCRLVRRGRTLKAMKEGNCWQTIFIHRVDILIIVGSVELTPSAINLLCFEKIDTFFMTTGGRYKGQLVFDYGKNVFLRQKQFRSLQDGDFCKRSAYFIVQGKMANMATLLGRIKRRNKPGKKGSFQKNVSSIRKLLKEIHPDMDVSRLRGYEGMATVHFFEGLRNGLKDNWNFNKRVRRPPTDPVNSVLSFLYTLLMNRVFTAVKIVGLDPAVGYLHSLDYGRGSLVLDLMEEFRSIVVETCTLSLFNLRILKKDDFYFLKPEIKVTENTEKLSVLDDTLGAIYENPGDGFMDLEEQRVEPSDHPQKGSSGDKVPCRLYPDSLKLVIQAFEEKLTTEFFYHPRNDKITYSDALIEQARQFRQYLEGKKNQYEPLLMK